MTWFDLRALLVGAAQGVAVSVVALVVIGLLMELTGRVVDRKRPRNGLAKPLPEHDEPRADERRLRMVPGGRQ